VAADFEEVFALLKPLMAHYEKRLFVKADTGTEYTLVTKSPSPHPQHRANGCISVGSFGQGLCQFPSDAVVHVPGVERGDHTRLEKAYAGQTCFNFKVDPGPQVLADLQALAKACLEDWRARKWL